MNKIGIFGLWHLGCVLAASWSKLGNKVVGFDYDPEIVNNLKNARPPIYEPHLSETIEESLNNKTLTFSNDIMDLDDCDFVFIAYDTPVDDDDESDTSILFKSINDLKKILKSNSIVIVSSQSPVGVCSELRKILIEQNPTLDLAYSPENLRLGEAIKCYLEPERIILGTANRETRKACTDLFGQIQGKFMGYETQGMYCMNLESAEMVKHGINSFLATSIVFANHLADICSEKGANIKDVIEGIKSDPRIGRKAYLSPGTGFSGGTLGRDLKVLKKSNNGGYAKIFESIHKFNSERKFSIISKMEKLFGNLNGKNIGILGLTYKPGTSTLRRSLPLEIIDILVEKGAKVKAFDPKADYSELTDKPKFEISDSIENVSQNTDFIVLLTEWSEFREYNWLNLENVNIFDTKNFLNPNVFKEKINYYSL